MVETVVSNFLFGLAVVWLLHRESRAGAVTAEHFGGRDRVPTVAHRDTPE